MVYCVDHRIWQRAAAACRDKTRWGSSVMPYYQRMSLQSTSIFMLGTYLTPLHIKAQVVEALAESHYWTERSRGANINWDLESYINWWIDHNLEQIPGDVREFIQDARRKRLQPGNVGSASAAHHRIGATGAAR